MKVLKFGGTSVGTVDSLRNVKAIVEGQSEPVIVVVSALGGITDKLINTGKLACQGDITYLENYAQIVSRHHDVIKGIVPENLQLEVFSIVDPLLEELENIYRGVALIKDLSQRTLNIIVSYGERISSVIISSVINDARHFNSRNFIKTENWFNKNIADTELTNKLIHETFDNFDGKVAVVPGFISTDRDSGDITNLGRGGSDYTAAIIAAALDAKVLEIWTDVDGFMTADPRVINNAYVIDHLSFIESMELCNFGAKVIYPPTIYPVFHKNIPIRIKNTFNPEAPGTWITDEPSHSDKPIKGISSINDTCLITVKGLGMVGVIGINSRIFNALAKKGVSVFLVSQAASENNTSFAVLNADSENAVKVLKEEFATELSTGEITEIIPEHDLATVAIVGENMKQTPGIAGRLFNTLGRNGINVIACAQGASQTNISFVIKIENLRKALNVIHDSFFLSDQQVLNLYIVGLGNVGRSLLEQIKIQRKSLAEHKALKLNVVGIANSHKAIFDSEGIELSEYQSLLESSNIKSSPDEILRHIIGMDIFNPVFVDCTASAEIASLYADLLSGHVNVVAANKISAASEYRNYSRLKEIAHKKDVKYLFETNVGAGLPIINTINALINSGDKILKIEAVVSGTLNFIFDTISDKVSLSQAIKLAKEAGFTEPDPRIDLSGKDVVRKLLILARESSYEVEESDVAKNLFIPNELFGNSPEEFISNVEKYVDEEFECRRRDAEHRGCQFRFVATLSEGKLSVGLQEVDNNHPFFDLKGCNNVISITTDRYREYPMIIKGYGAGSAVTAAGVFADIISIANIR